MEAHKASMSLCNRFYGYRVGAKCQLLELEQKSYKKGLLFAEMKSMIGVGNFFNLEK